MAVGDEHQGPRAPSGTLPHTLKIPPCHPKLRTQPCLLPPAVLTAQPSPKLRPGLRLLAQDHRDSPRHTMPAPHHNFLPMPSRSFHCSQDPGSDLLLLSAPFCCVRTAPGPWLTECHLLLCGQGHSPFSMNSLKVTQRPQWWGEGERRAKEVGSPRTLPLLIQAAPPPSNASGKRKAKVRCLLKVC